MIHKTTTSPDILTLKSYNFVKIVSIYIYLLLSYCEFSTIIVIFLESLVSYVNIGVNKLKQLLV